MSTSWPLVFRAPQVVGLDAPTQQVLDELVRSWAARQPRNLERMTYLDGKNLLKDLKVALPPNLVGLLAVVMGWPEKAVYELSNRVVLERVVSPDGDADPFGLGGVLYDNRFDVELPQAVTSSAAQSVAFVTTTPGDQAVGEPAVVLMFHSALWSTGLWDRRRRALRAGLVVADTDTVGSPTVMTILLPDEHVVVTKGAGGWYVSAVVAHRLGRVPMEVLPYRPTLERPFGRSRVDRRVMSLTDRAMRAAARLEVHSELFSAMKLILLGADEQAFVDRSGRPVPLWQFYMGRLNTLTKDEDGDLPRLEQIRAESPEPHIAVLRQLAAEFSGHTGVPLGSLGISTDNPESGDAKAQARQDIIGDAEAQHRIYGAALRRVLENAVMIRDRLTDPPAGVRDLQLRWRRPDRPTLAAQADAGAKIVATVPDLAGTEVGMELVGLDPDQIVRSLAAQHREQSMARLDRLAALATDGPGQADANVRDQAEALGILIRAGVSPDEAASRVGLSGIRFDAGLIPTSLKSRSVELSLDGADATQ